MKLPKSQVELMYCKYPKFMESWSTAGTQKLGRAGLLQVPKSQGELVYCRYPKVLEPLVLWQVPRLLEITGLFHTLKIIYFWTDGGSICFKFLKTVSNNQNPNVAYYNYTAQTGIALNLVLNQRGAIFKFRAGHQVSVVSFIRVCLSPPPSYTG